MKTSKFGLPVPTSVSMLGVLRRRMAFLSNNGDIGLGIGAKSSSILNLGEGRSDAGRIHDASLNISEEVGSVVTEVMRMGSSLDTSGAKPFVG